MIVLILWVTIYMGKPSAVGQLTRPTQPFILLGSINEYADAAIRRLLLLDSGGAVWSTLTS